MLLSFSHGFLFVFVHFPSFVSVLKIQNGTTELKSAKEVCMQKRGSFGCQSDQTGRECMYFCTTEGGKAQ